MQGVDDRVQPACVPSVAPALRNPPLAVKWLHYSTAQETRLVATILFFIALKATFDPTAPNLIAQILSSDFDNSHDPTV